MGQPKGCTPWNKNKTGLQVNPRKGKTKDNDPVCKAISEKLMGHDKFGDCGKYVRTQEIKLKNSLSRTGKCLGDTNPNYKGGISFYHGEDWNKVKLEIFKRDKFSCQLGGSTNRVIQVHHVVPYRICKEHTPENLITLCQYHHRKVDNHLRRKEYQGIVRAENINEISELGRNILAIYTTPCK